MDQFVVSARKYRPSTFNSVVGQSSITNTLKNAIKSKHLAHAFLFCGPRGVGKTTCARILAKTINCTNLTTETEGCNQCESCVSFNNGQSLNIFELDAASNSSVDDVRNLVEQVRYAPQSGNYKIYIIDEVHMLSSSAFNAFLKTLEEPPPYAIFILATTEKHKIIPTILSRCQIFDFNRITIDDISRHLAWVAENEHVTAEPEALHMIAQKADGALRDALSIFDQIVSFAGNEVTYKHVIDNLNILDYEYFFKITDYLITGDFVNALLLLNEIIEEGFDVHHFISGLSGHFRDLLVSLDTQTLPLLEVSEKTRIRYKAQAKQYTPGLLFKFLEIGNRCDVEFKASQKQRLHVELALLKMCALRSEVFSKMPTNEATTSIPEKKNNPVEETMKQTVPVTENKKPVSTITPSPVPAAEPKSISVATAIPLEKENIVSTPETNPKIPTVTRSRAAGNGTISITQKLRSGNAIVENKTNEPEHENLPSGPLDEKIIVSVIKDLAGKLQAEGRRQLAAAMNKHAARLINESLIEIPVDNPIQAGEIQENRQELLAYLKEKLSNGTIQLQARLAESHEGTDTAYTPAEKFNKMAEKNPDLNQLRQQFDLELDF